ncbi:MAG TPA: hypothetical protein VFQ53_22475 [Kofleriaceae bacterium]|nr:hypothetical protein [Kofleriaceae bacterium]
MGADDSLGEDTSALTSPVYPTAHPRIYLTPNRTRLKTALDNNTAAASAFRTKVDQWVAGSDIWGFQAWNAALMGQLTGNSKYCSKAIATVEAQVATAEQKIAGGAAPEVANDSYLGIGEMIGDLALVYDWCYASVSSSQRTRWINYANQAIYNVWNPSSATWGGRSFPWSGWSINNPSNNYYYSFLRATMLMGLATKGESAKADTWISTFRNAKIGNQLVPTFNTDLVGGASREGTGYGVAMRRLFELYDLWYATTGEQISKLTSHTRNSMLAFMHQVVPTLDKVAPTGDQSRDSTAAFFDYHRNYLQELIGLMPTDTVSGRAKTMLAQSSIKQMSSGFMVAYDFLYDRPDVTTRSLSGLNTAYYAKGIGEVYARSDWGKTATWVNLIAGPYTESHAHQDQGSLMIYKGGWLAYDSVINSRSGLNQDTGSHSLVRIDSGSTPLRQIANTISKVTALHQGPGWVHISADVTAAYGGNSLVQKVQREIVYIQPNIVVVYDRVATSSGTYQTWQLASPVAPSISGNAATFSNAGHTLKVTRMQPSSATTSTYAFSSSSDFTGGYRLNEKVSGADNRFLHVMSIDGAASSITSTGTTSQPGVTINLASGGTATVKFNRDSVGGVLTLAGVTTTLTAAVDALPN